MPKLKADVRAPEFIHRNRQLQQLGPAGAVVVIKHEGAVFASGRLSGAEGDKILAEETRRRHLKVIPKAASNRFAVCRLPKQHSTWNDPLRPLLPVPARTAATGLWPFNSEAGLPGPPVPRVGLGDVGDTGTGESDDAAKFSIGCSQKPLCL